MRGQGRDETIRVMVSEDGAPISTVCRRQVEVEQIGKPFGVIIVS
jgi:hypothetical protein